MTAKPTSPNMRAAVYLRISSDPKDTQLGVGRQREDCAALCAARGWEPVEYLDNDVSASNGKHRPGYEKMLTDIAAGQLVAVVAWDLDRLHRRPIELERFMALADEHRLALATVSGDVDLSTEQGRLVARMKGNVAAYEIGQMKTRMRRKHRQNAENGIPHWARAFGYTANHQPDPVTAPLVADAYAAVLAGSSLADICALFNDAQAFTVNGKRWTPALVSTFLHAPRNAGLRSHTRDGKTEIIGKGTWPALVDEALWRATRSALDGRARRTPGRRTVRKHLLTGVLGCGKCGHYLSGNYTTLGPLSYSCRRCRGVFVRATDVEPLVYRLVSGRLAMPDAVDLLKAEIHDEAEAERLRGELNTLHGEIEAIGTERGEGLLTGQQAKTATDIVIGKIKALEHRDAERLRIFADLPLGAPEVAAAIDRLSPDRFRAVLDVLATIVVAPVGRGCHVFNPERVHVDWR
jgi:DNA invertase Pin-like site-specific DNA recombinase